jgi:hypothetical protein
MTDAACPRYQEHSITTILEYFVKGFTIPDGQELASYDWFYDPHQGKVVFRLWLYPKDIP